MKQKYRSSSVIWRLFYFWLLAVRTGRPWNLLLGMHSHCWRIYFILHWNMCVRLCHIHNSVLKIIVVHVMNIMDTCHYKLAILILNIYEPCLHSADIRFNCSCIYSASATHPSPKSFWMTYTFSHLLIFGSSIFKYEVLLSQRLKIPYKNSIPRALEIPGHIFESINIAWVSIDPCSASWFHIWINKHKISRFSNIE
jgi:hypothetical protein